MTDQIHDSTFKELMGQKDFFINFCRAYLPKNVFDCADWSSLKPIAVDSAHRNKKTKKSFIADIVYAVYADNLEHLIFVHAEHFSYDDKLWLIRMANYQTGILLKHADSNKLTSLPPIVSIMYRQGRRPFEGSRKIHDAFENPDMAKKYLFNPIVVDLPSIPDEQLQSHTGIAPADITFKYIFEDFTPHHQKMLLLLKQANRKTRQILIEYVMRQADIDVDQFQQATLLQMTEEEDTTMTIAKQLEERGAERKEKELVLNFHRIGVSIETISQGTKISPEKIKKIIEAAAKSDK